MRVARYPIPTLIAAAFVLAAPVGAAAAAASTSTAAGPPSSMFKTGYNKCKLASLAAISKAAGKTYSKAKFDGKTCTWSSSDGNYVILVDTHPAGYLDLMVPSIGKHADGEAVKAISVPGASKAVLDTHPYASTHRYQKDLFAEYPQGDVQVSMDYSTALPDSKLVAVMRVGDSDLASALSYGGRAPEPTPLGWRPVACASARYRPQTQGLYPPILYGADLRRGESGTTCLVVRWRFERFVT